MESLGEHYYFGIEEIDEQHQAFFDIVERATLLFHSEQGQLYGYICTLLEEMEAYVVSHFDYEEKLMETISFPELADHQFEHELLKAQMRKVNTTLIENNEEKYLLKTLQFLVDWTLKHIAEDDAVFATYYHKAQDNLSKRLG